ncbi:MAG TPA: hypothetical protein VI756_25795 [Blastocatellia bacterium]
MGHWSSNLKAPVLRAEASAAIDALELDMMDLSDSPGQAGPENTSVVNQFEQAKAAAKVLLPSIDGPTVVVSMSGRVGHSVDPNLPTDRISIIVAGMLEPH